MQHATSSPLSVFRRMNRDAAAVAPSSSLLRADIVMQSNSSVSPPLDASSFKTITKDAKRHGAAQSSPLAPTAQISLTTELAFTFVSRTKSIDSPATAAKLLSPATPTSTNTNSRAIALAEIKTKAIASVPPLAEDSKNTSFLRSIASSGTLGLDSNNSSTVADSDIRLAESVKSNVPSKAAFDLRSALRIDSARAQYKLPSLIASLSPPTSPKHGPPYTVPSTADRNKLRTQRASQFKARPLNPKVLTSAGDLGVPRIQKRPLTVPVGPVLTKSRVRHRMAAHDAKPSLVKRRAMPAPVQKTKGRQLASTGLESTRRPLQQDHVMENVKETLTLNMHGDVVNCDPVLDAREEPLIVPTVDPMLATMRTNLCSIAGPPQRELVSSRKAPPTVTTAGSWPAAVTTASAGTEDLITTPTAMSLIPKPTWKPTPSATTAASDSTTAIPSNAATNVWRRPESRKPSSIFSTSKLPRKQRTSPAVTLVALRKARRISSSRSREATRRHPSSSSTSGTGALTLADL